ncbi:response regulator [bacterium SCSIO 12741]|nr:response regulator [bacterium SCSIO 12741]
MKRDKLKYWILPVLALAFIASILLTVFKASTIQSRVEKHQVTLRSLGKLNEELNLLRQDISHIDVMDTEQLQQEFAQPICKRCIPPQLLGKITLFLSNLDVNTSKREVAKFYQLTNELIQQENQKLYEDTLSLKDQWILVGVLSIIACFFALLSSILYVQNLNKNRILNETNIKLNEAHYEMERSVSAKIAFLNMLSHEIRTPLNAVIGLTNIITTEKSTDQQAKNLDLLKFSSESLLSLINDVLDFGKIEAGKLVLEDREFNLKKLLTKIIGSLEPNANAKNLSLQLEYDNTIPNQVITDPTRISQILFNLIMNGIKFTHSGSITLRVERVGPQEEKVPVKFSVMDTGIGIEPSKIGAIFSQFVQATTDTPRLYGGSGLGLGITQKLINLLGGEIEVNSELQKGSTFYFTLNLKCGAEKLQIIKPETKELDGKLKTGRVLLVEDNRINRLIISKYLQGINCEVEFAENGLIALQKIEPDYYDLILMDLQMPELDGYSTAEKIRLKYSEQELPIIAISATSGHMLQRDYRESGINDFLPKPVDHSELINKVLKYL